MGLAWLFIVGFDAEGGHQDRTIHSETGDEGQDHMQQHRCGDCDRSWIQAV